MARGVRKQGAEGYGEVDVRYLLLFETWKRGVRVALGYRRTWMDVLFCGTTIPIDAKEFASTTWEWPGELWPMEREQKVRRGARVTAV